MTIRNNNSENISFSRERKSLNLIISFLEYLLNLLNLGEFRTNFGINQGIYLNVGDVYINVGNLGNIDIFKAKNADNLVNVDVFTIKIKIRKILKELYTLNLALFISDLTQNKDLITSIKNEVCFDFFCIDQRNIEEFTQIFDCIPVKKNIAIPLLSVKARSSNQRLLYLEIRKKNSGPIFDILIHANTNFNINDKEKINLLDFIFKKALNVFFNDKNISYSLENYIKIIEKRLKDLDNLKTEIEQFLAKDVLKNVSKEYEQKAQDSIKIPILGNKSKWFVFFLLALLFIFTPLFVIPILLDGKTWHDILIKVSIGFIPIIVGFYLLRYSLKLRDLQEEYKFKSIMLSSLPALSILIDDKNERDKIITTILLEASNLQTLTKDKGEIVKEILPIVELANKLKNS